MKTNVELKRSFADRSKETKTFVNATVRFETKIIGFSYVI